MISIIITAAAVIWFVLAFFLSHQGGTGTTQLSLGMTRWLVRQLNRVTGFDVSVEAFHILLRRSAHVIVFLVLAALVCMSLWLLSREYHQPLRPWIGFLFCIVFCLLDEVTKIGISGRHFSWFDVGLNVIGCLVGGGIYWLIRSRVERTGRS